MADETARLAIEITAPNADKVAGDLDKVGKAADGLGKAADRLAPPVKEIRRVLDEVATPAARGARALADHADAATAAANAHSGLSGQAQAAGHAVRSFVDSVAAGQSPTTALIQQMGHLSYAASGQGGLVGAFSQLGGSLGGALRFINPLTVGLAAVAGGAVAAYRSMDQALEARQATTGGIGRLGQATASDVSTIAQRTAGNGVSLGEAREGVLAFVRAGVQSNEVMERGNKLAQQYATTTGQALPDAQKELAQALADPAKGIDLLQSKLKTFDADSITLVKDLASRNDAIAAGNVILAKMPPLLVSAADATSDLGRVWAYTKSQIFAGAEVAGSIVTLKPRDTSAAQRAAQQALASGANLRPGFTGETIRGGDAAPPELVAADRERAASIEADARALERRNLIQSQTNETIRKATEAHQLEVAAIHARTDAERAGVVTTQTFLDLEHKVGDEAARSAAQQAGDRVFEGRGAQQAATTRASAADIQAIKALGAEQNAAAASARVLARDQDNLAGAVDASSRVIAEAAKTERVRDLVHAANMQSISAFTEAEHEAATGTQAYTAAVIGGASAAQANKAATQAMTEERGKDGAASQQITRAHEANLQAITALTTAERANAAASVAAAGQREGSLAAATAATAAYREELARAAVVQRDFDRNLGAAQGNAMREAQAQLQAAQLPIGPGRQRQAGQIGAAAEAQGQIATIQAQNPNIQIDTSAFVQAAQDVAALSESARQASTSLQLIQQWGTQAAQLNISTDVLNGSISKADGAYRQVVASGMAQVNALGLEGDARDKATDAINRAGAAAYNNAIAQGQSQQRAAEAADLAARNVQALARDAEMAAQGISDMGVALKNIVHDTTISAADANGKTLGSGVTLTGILTQEGYYRAEQFKAAKIALDALNARHANDGLRATATSIASPVASLADNAGSNLDSAKSAVKDAEKALADAQKSAKSAAAQPMANASKSDPRQDPYLSQIESVYYGTATEQFYKEISYQQASLNAADAQLSAEQEGVAAAQDTLQTAQQALATAQSQYDTLQRIAASANTMAQFGASPAAIGASVAAALASAGYAKSAQDVATATDAYAYAAQQATLQNKIAASKGEGTGYGGTIANSIPTGASAYTLASPFTPLRDVPHIGNFASGTPGVTVPGVGGIDQLYTIGLTPGESLSVGKANAVPSGGGSPVQLTQYNTIHVSSEDAAETIMHTLESAASRAVQMRGVMSMAAA